MEALELDLLAADLDRSLGLFVTEADERFVCHLTQYQCAPSPSDADPAARSAVFSPDGSRAAFIRDQELS